MNRSLAYRLIVVPLIVAIIVSSCPAQGWLLVFGVRPAYAAPVELGPTTMGSETPASSLLSSLQEAMPPELTGALAEIGALAPDGQPQGMLMDVGALQAAVEQEPDALANPLSVSRMQSAYTATQAVSHTLIITLTVTNDRLPSSPPPQLPISATVTDTIEALSAFDLSKDPNVIHNVLLADTVLLANASLISSDPAPDRQGDTLAWNLGNVLPLGSVTATLVVSVPTNVMTFTTLDTGAAAWGTLQGRTVSASTAPAVLAPDDMAQWLVWTVDADYYDEYALQKAAELGNDWEQIFAYVRSLSYESYKGSLRGTRGTLWSEAGNSLDQASLLTALLRGSGVPARYRHGDLGTAHAQELILSMFPDPQGVIGHVPPGTEVADPANDPQLLEETIDHWWVEAYVAGRGWTNLDPCFADAAPGQTFYASLALDGTDRIAELPDTLRHKVTMTVKVETYHPLSPLQSGLSYAYPLSYTFNTVELVGKPVNFGHMVNTDQQGGAVFYSIKHTYVPYFAVGDWEMAVEGSAFQELKSNFPFGNLLVTGEWLLFDVRDARDKVERYEREIVDRIGFDIRQTGGTPNIGERIGKAPIWTDAETFA